MLALVGQIQWGDFATWVASVGTVAAVVVALVQVYRERRARLVQEKHDREKAQEDEMSGIALMPGWFGLEWTSRRAPRGGVGCWRRQVRGVEERLQLADPAVRQQHLRRADL